MDQQTEIQKRLRDLARSVERLQAVEIPTGIPAVAALPTDPATIAALVNQRRWRTSDNMGFFSDGTRWLSTTPHSIVLPFTPGITYPANATALQVSKVSLPNDAYSIYIEKFVIKFQVNATFDSTNNWTFFFARQDSTGTLNNIISSPAWQASRTAGTPYVNPAAVNSVFAPASMNEVALNVTKNVSPGTLNFDPPVMWYRLVG